MQNRNYLRKLAYLSLSLLVSFSFFISSGHTQTRTHQLCHQQCLKSNLKGFTGSNAKKLDDCENKCVKAANEAKAQSM